MTSDYSRNERAGRDVATFAPPTLVALGAYWEAHHGVNLGIVGDTAHTATGTSYHLGKSDLRADAYSRQLARDKAGLSEAASAFDFGKLNGTLAGLQAFSRDLVARARAGDPGFDDVREIIYSPNGIAVRRWDNVDKVLRVGGDGTNQGDNSHRYHTHVSWFRDAEFRDHTAIVRPYFEDNMIRFTAPIDEVGGTITTKVDTEAIPITGGTRPSLKAGITRPALGVFTLDDLADRPAYLMLVGAQLCFVGEAAVTFVKDDGPNPAPSTPAVPTVLASGIYEVKP
jgi:hypothetical protein